MQLVYDVLNIASDSATWIALVLLGSLVLRQEKRHRDEQRLIRRTHAAIMSEVTNGNL